MSYIIFWDGVNLKMVWLGKMFFDGVGIYEKSRNNQNAS